VHLSTKTPRTSVSWWQSDEMMWGFVGADTPTTPEEKRKVNRINDFWKPFYFRWVETFLEKGKGEDIVPLKHFLHRFTRSVFWELEDMIPL